MELSVGACDFAKRSFANVSLLPPLGVPAIKSHTSVVFIRDPLQELTPVGENDSGGFYSEVP